MKIGCSHSCEMCLLQTLSQHQHITCPMWRKRKKKKKGCILYGFIYMTFPKRQNCRKRKQNRGCQDLAEDYRVYYKEAEWNFLRELRVFYILIVVTWLNEFVKNHRTSLKKMYFILHKINLNKSEFKRKHYRTIVYKTSNLDSSKIYYEK